MQWTRASSGSGLWSEMAGVCGVSSHEMAMRWLREGYEKAMR